MKAGIEGDGDKGWNERKEMIMERMKGKKIDKVV